MRRFFYYSFRFVSSLRYRLLRRFTPAGLLVLGALIASAGMGLDTNQTLAYQAFTLFLALVALSLGSSLFFRSDLKARRKLPRFGTVGESLTYRVIVENHTPKEQKGLVLMEDLQDPRPGLQEYLLGSEPRETGRNFFKRTVGYHRWLRLISLKRKARLREQALPPLSPGRETEVQVDLVPTRRGYLRFTGLTIARPDPLGLFKAFRRVPEPDSLLILPRRYPLPDLELPGSRRYQPGGVALASGVGDSEEFLSMRDYRPGDPLRHIHWRSWAKAGVPIVKEFQDEFFVRHALILDTFREAGPDDLFEEAVSIAASFVCTVQTRESLLDLMFVGTEAYCFTSGRGVGGMDRMLEILGAVNVCRDRSFSQLPPLVFQRAELLSGCVCIFLSWDQERRDFVDRLQSVGIPLTVLVVVPDGDAGSIDPGPMRGDLHHFHPLELSKIREGLARI